MMVPRAYLFTSNTQPTGMKEQAAPLSPGFHFLKNVPTIGSATTPMGIPTRRGQRPQLHRDPSYTPSKSTTSSRRSSTSSSSDRPMPTAFTSMLKATAIPVPRRSWSTSKPKRKLQRGSQVDEFSRLMQAPLRSKEEDLTAVNSPLDILLSPPEDNEKYPVPSESVSEPAFSVQSLLSDSMPSLDHDVGSPFSINQPPTPGSQKSPSERRQLRYSLAEDCALDHPLLETDDSDFDLVIEDPVLYDEAPTKEPSPRSFPRLRSSFKSNLTASLRAIKSAAQSVSTFATPSVQPDDFLTRSLFTFTPEMTDDRRPLPMQDPPSPALRRYLNPTPISPAEMYVYHEQPQDSPANQAFVSIQMQTYRRSRSKGHRRNHFQVISTQNRDKFHAYDPESPPMSRQREPRENSDFLRMVVLEMNMRRHGKLRDDIPTRAHIWLPPRKNNPYRSSLDFEDCDEDGAVPPRWVGISA